MAENPYAFGDERTLRDVLEEVRKLKSVVESRNDSYFSLPQILFVEVTEVVSDYEFKAVTREWDHSASPNPSYVAPLGTAITFDSDLYASESDKTFYQKNIMTDTAVNVGDFVEVIFYPDRSETLFYKARIGGGGTGLFYIEITGSTNFSTYTGTIYDNEIDRNIVEEGVTVRILQTDAGVMPNSDAGKGVICRYNASNDIYIVVNPSVFYG